MALASLYRVIQDLQGNVVTDVLGTITLAGTSTLASLFSDSAGTAPLPNPLVNNATYGSFQVYVGAGLYDMSFIKAGYTFETQRAIPLRDPSAGVNQLIGTANQVLVSPVGGVGNVTLSLPQSIDPDAAVQFGRLGLGMPAPTLPVKFACDNVAITGGSATFTGRVNANLGLTALNYTGDDASAFYTTLAAAGGTGRFAILCQGDAPSQFNGHVQLVANKSLLFSTGSTTPSMAAILEMVYPRATMGGMALRASADTGPGAAVSFLNGSGGYVGSITTTSSATAYGTSSDPRLKQDVCDLEGAMAVIQALRPVQFTWRADGAGGVGFLADEVAAVVDGVTTGTPDAVDENGQIVPMSIDLSKLIPWLVAGMQALTARLETLEAAG